MPRLTLRRAPRSRQGVGTAARRAVLGGALQRRRSATDPAPPGTFTGKIVACQRGVNARVDKGFNVAQGGAAGMILYNPTLADVETDNHWLPTVHLADGTAFLAFLVAHPGRDRDVHGRHQGQRPGRRRWRRSRPAVRRGLFIKPDVTAPGVQILAGHTPTPESITEGPPGEYFQAIAGTSMSAPHVAGAAILVRAVPSVLDARPGQVGADDLGRDDHRRQGRPDHAGRPVRHGLRPDPTSAAWRRR